MGLSSLCRFIAYYYFMHVPIKGKKATLNLAWNKAGNNEPMDGYMTDYSFGLPQPGLSPPTAACWAFRTIVFFNICSVCQSLLVLCFSPIQ